MRTSKNVLAVAATIVCCIIAIWLSTSIQGGQRTYELQPRLTVPEYKTDVARITDAYERLMERYMDLTERNSALLGTDLRDVVMRLESIDSSLNELSARIAGIEKAFGIEQPKKLTGKSLGTRTDHPDNELALESPK